MRNRQVLMSVPPEVRERIQKLAAEVGHEVAQMVQRDLDVPAAEVAVLRQKLPFLVAQLQKAMKGFPQWYNVHGDEQRARLFIRYVSHMLPVFTSLVCQLTNLRCSDIL